MEEEQMRVKTKRWLIFFNDFTLIENHPTTNK